MFISEVGSRQFKSRTGQTEHDVANGSPRIVLPKKPSRLRAYSLFDFENKIVNS